MGRRRAGTRTRGRHPCRPPGRGRAGRRDGGRRHGTRGPRGDTRTGRSPDRPYRCRSGPGPAGRVGRRGRTGQDARSGRAGQHAHRDRAGPCAPAGRRRSSGPDDRGERDDPSGPSRLCAQHGSVGRTLMRRRVHPSHGPVDRSGSPSRHPDRRRSDLGRRNARQDVPDPANPGGHPRSRSGRHPGRPTRIPSHHPRRSDRFLRGGNRLVRRRSVGPRHHRTSPRGSRRDGPRTDRDDLFPRNRRPCSTADSTSRTGSRSGGPRPDDGRRTTGHTPRPVRRTGPHDPRGPAAVGRPRGGPHSPGHRRRGRWAGHRTFRPRPSRRGRHPACPGTPGPGSCAHRRCGPGSRRTTGPGHCRPGSHVLDGGRRRNRSAHRGSPRSHVGRRCGPCRTHGSRTIRCRTCPAGRYRDRTRHLLAARSRDAPHQIDHSVPGSRRDHLVAGGDRRNHPRYSPTDDTKKWAPA